jgi:hypothetical protein
MYKWSINSFTTQAPSIVTPTCDNTKVNDVLVHFADDVRQWFVLQMLTYTGGSKIYLKKENSRNEGPQHY